MREGGGKCLKYLKREWNRTERRGNKDFKKGGGGGKLGQGVGALKMGGRGGWARTPLQTMVSKTVTFTQYSEKCNEQILRRVQE